MQSIKVHPVNEKSWPRVKEILTTSLQHLKLYKLFCKDPVLRELFMKDYIEQEYQKSKRNGKSFFWYCQLDGPQSGDDFSNIFMAARLKLPAGVFLSKQTITLSDISTFAGAQNVLCFRNEQVEHSVEQKDNIIASKYPVIFKELNKYRNWMKSYEKQLCKCLGPTYWEGCNIAVDPKHRNRGEAVSCMKRAMIAFIHLTTAANCKLLMANTGVPMCRMACKHAGFEEVGHYWFADIERWVMLTVVGGEKETSSLKEN